MVKRREKIFKGIISLLVLKELWESPSYGYLLDKKISSGLGEKLSNGEIYSVVRNLEIRGYIKVQRESGGGRVRKYYEISENGRNFLLTQARSLTIASKSIEEIRVFINGIES